MSKALPQGFDLAYDAHGLDTVRVAMTPGDADEVVDCIHDQYDEDSVVVTLCGWLEKCPNEQDSRRGWEALAEKLAGALRKLLDAHIYGAEVDAAFQQADRAITAYDKAREGGNDEPEKDV